MRFFGSFWGNEVEAEIGRLNEYEVNAHVVPTDDGVGGREGGANKNLNIS